MSVTDVSIAPLKGPDSTNLAPRPGVATLVVNVASRCGLTPQYEGLERLQRRYADRGFTVLGVPCNQFGGQEPGTAAEIAVVARFSPRTDPEDPAVIAAIEALL